MSEIVPLVDHLFRHSAGQMISALTNLFGPSRLDLAEEVVQEALLQALQSWPYGGVPANPKAWLLQVARNRARDILRREGALSAKLQALGNDLVPAAEPPDEAEPVTDDELAMIFMCCHPALSRLARTTLTLKTVCGFSTDEIAAALLAQPAAVAQRLVRVKRQIKLESIPFGIPSAAELSARRQTVLEVLYLLFNEGYSAHGGAELVRTDLCAEAIRLAEMLAANPATAGPPVHALLALMYLQASRLPARLDGAGDLLLLDEQDRSRWDSGLVARGLRYLGQSATGDEVTAYHLEAAIAACHATAPDTDAIDWAQILALYDDLLTLKRTPVALLNRAIALAMVEGPEAGISAIQRLAGLPALRRYHLLPAALGALWLRAGRPEQAAACYQAALAMRCSEPERRFLERQLERCDGSPTPRW